MKLTYHDHTPEEYEPPYFVPVDSNTAVGHFKVRHVRAVLAGPVARRRMTRAPWAQSRRAAELVLHGRRRLPDDQAIQRCMMWGHGHGHGMPPQQQAVAAP